MYITCVSEDVYSSIRGFEEYPTTRRLKKSSHSSGRRVPEVKLSSFVRARSANAQKRCVNRKKNRQRKYSGSCLLIDDDSDSHSHKQKSSRANTVRSTPRKCITPPRTSATYGQSPYMSSISNNSGCASCTMSGMGSPRTPTRLKRNISDHLASNGSAFSSTLKAGLLSPPKSSSNRNASGDSLSRVIFRALFGPILLTQSSTNWMDDDDDNIDSLESCRSIEVVDEAWFNGLINNSLLTSKALGIEARESDTLSISSGCSRPVKVDSCVFSTSSSAVECMVVSSNRTASITSSPGLAVPPEYILSTFIDAHFITCLVNQLPFEDDRFTSPRVSVLKALYLNCPYLRETLVNSLREVSHLRLARCKVGSRIAVRDEVDPNYLSLKESLDYMDDIRKTPDSLESCISSTSCDLFSNSNSTIRTASMFTTFVSSSASKPTVLFPSLGPQMSTDINSSGLSNSAITRDHDNFIVELALYMVISEPILTNPTSSRGDISAYNRSFILETVLHVIVNILKCYGRRLGKSTESVEEPAVLQNTLIILSELIPRMEVNKVDSLILPAILRCWPGGENSVREIAFLKALGIALPFCTNRSSLSSQPPATHKDTIPSLASFPRASPKYQCLVKLTRCTTSLHFKVALEAIQLCIHPAIVILFMSDKDSECSNLLETLVDNLRADRSHWNVLVRKSAECALDSLLCQM
mmetsp:Transcript_11751/g.17795  ORF Transcript_11751/g.17795 Transcript_11751/m.17795 type:complete len:698 (-) Transcript_11751:176-2269(-)